MWDTTVLAALIGFIVAAIGWYVEYRRAAEQRQWEAQLQRLKSQIEELYGPLSGLNHQGKIIYSAALELLPSDNGKVILDKFTTDEHEKTWQFFIETYFLPINARRAELINTKSYLSEHLEANKLPDQLPDSFIQFLEHQVQGDCLYRLGKLKKEYAVFLQNFLSLPYPEEFDKHVEESLSRLRKKYSEILSLYHPNKKGRWQVLQLNRLLYSNINKVKCFCGKRYN
jgi:hypothetical protein